MNNFGFSKNAFGGSSETKIAGNRPMNMGEDGGRRSVDEVREAQMKANSSTGFIVDTTVDYSKKSEFIVDTTKDFSDKSYNTGVDNQNAQNIQNNDENRTLTRPYESQYGNLTTKPSAVPNSNGNVSTNQTPNERNANAGSAYSNPVNSAGMTGAFKNDFSQSHIPNNDSSFNAQTNQNDFNKNRLQSMRQVGTNNQGGGFGSNPGGFGGFGGNNFGGRGF